MGAPDAFVGRCVCVQTAILPALPTLTLQVAHRYTYTQGRLLYGPVGAFCACERMVGLLHAAVGEVLRMPGQYSFKGSPVRTCCKNRTAEWESYPCKSGLCCDGLKFSSAAEVPNNRNPPRKRPGSRPLPRRPGTKLKNYGSRTEKHCTLYFLCTFRCGDWCRVAETRPKKAVRTRERAHVHRRQFSENISAMRA